MNSMRALASILRADALFEAVLATYLIACVAVWPEGVRMADPASDTVIVIVAVALLAAGGAIWALSMRSDRLSVLALAVDNDAGAALFLGWLAAADGFSPPAAGLLLGVAASLMALAVAEIIALPRPVSAGAAR